MSRREGRPARTGMDRWIYNGSGTIAPDDHDRIVTCAALLAYPIGYQVVLPVHLFTCSRQTKADAMSPKARGDFRGLVL